MKKVLVVVLACVFVFGSVCLARAQEPKESMSGKHMMKDSMKGYDKEGHEAMMKRDKGKKMHSMMMSKEMVASNDGGVIVLLGNKLQKYDKDLNLIKEVTIQADKECMAMDKNPPLDEEAMEDAKEM